MCVRIVSMVLFLAVAAGSCVAQAQQPCDYSSWANASTWTGSAQSSFQSAVTRIVGSNTETDSDADSWSIGSFTSATFSPSPLAPPGALEGTLELLGTGTYSVNEVSVYVPLGGGPSQTTTVSGGGSVPSFVDITFNSATSPCQYSITAGPIGSVPVDSSGVSTTISIDYFARFTLSMQSLPSPRAPLSGTISTGSVGTYPGLLSSAWTLTPNSGGAGIIAVIQGTPNAATLTMAPSVVTSKSFPTSYHTGQQTLAITLACEDNNGVLLPNCAVAFDFAVAAGSGGHVHTSGRPIGDFSSSQCVPQTSSHVDCNTGSTGVATLTYTAPEASGSTQASGTVTVNALTNKFSFTINVQYDGLVLASGPGLIVDTASQNHGNNNGWASGGTLVALQNMSAQFAQQLIQLGPNVVPPIHITAISLPLGGIFDYQDANWLPPHVAHRFGNNADVALNTPVPLTAQQRRALASALRKAGFQTPVPGERPSDPTSNHWHLVGPY